MTGANPATDFWPNALYDSREGVDRATAGPAPITAQGVMYYVELDAKNLVNWFTANQAALGLDNNTGYTLYFSDRRGEQKDPTDRRSDACKARIVVFGIVLGPALPAPRAAAVLQLPEDAHATWCRRADRPRRRALER